MDIMSREWTLDGIDGIVDVLHDDDTEPPAETNGIQQNISRTAGDVPEVRLYEYRSHGLIVVGRRRTRIAS